MSLNQSQDSEQREARFNITSRVKQSKRIFVYLQRTVRSSNQEHNPHILDTFEVNADNNDCYLSCSKTRSWKWCLSSRT